MKALDAAGIPVTDKTLALAEEMMRQGMPVNKQSLGNACRQMAMYPEAPVSDLVMLQKMDIPVTEENLSMMRLYQTNQHYLFSDLQSLSTRTADFLSEMVQSQPLDAAQNFVKGFLDIFREPVSTTQNEAALTGEVSQNLTTDTEGMVTEVKTRMDENASTAGKVIISEHTVEANTTGGFGIEEAETHSKEVELMRLLKGDGAKAEGARDALPQNLFSLLAVRMK